MISVFCLLSLITRKEDLIRGFPKKVSVHHSKPQHLKADPAVPLSQNLWLAIRAHWTAIASTKLPATTSHSSAQALLPARQDNIAQHCPQKRKMFLLLSDKWIPLAQYRSLWKKYLPNPVSRALQSFLLAFQQSLSKQWRLLSPFQNCGSMADQTTSGQTFCIHLRSQMTWITNGLSFISPRSLPLTCTTKSGGEFFPSPKRRGKRPG